ncbi:ileal sodium/bile acid cotransporter-like [Saccoglossus kowalevskii]|uniref:Ileal sodium/bile acid cotransporter-like n=1 Tax=Saccoglossus kowalevskii TaxID=10224 RepID=A0ABM0GIX0_SACKO|nr:PREDICTED: ileal sodium/bile acid cotransporter-like [Saccoglossus kowalevskii]
MEFTTELMYNSTITNDTDKELTELEEIIFLTDQILTYLTIILIMLGMGGATELGELRRTLRRPWGIIICWLSQFGLMPLVAFGIAHAADLRPELAIGLIIQCSSPGGSMSNVLAYYAKGNISLSICLTTCSTILAVGAMPLCLFLYGRSFVTGASEGTIVIPYVTVIISLVLILVPAGIGLVLKYKVIPKYINKVTQVCSLIGTLGILVGIVLRAIVNPGVYTSSAIEVWLITISLPVLAGAIGFTCSSIIRLPCSSRRTIAVETSCQNVALALTIINSAFPAGPLRAEMQIISSLYGPILAIEMLVVIGVFRFFLARGYCGCCNYGDKEDDKDENENGKEYLGGSSGAIEDKDALKMKESAINGIAYAPEISHRSIVKKVNEVGTNTEFEYTNFAFEDFEEQTKNASVNTDVTLL